MDEILRKLARSVLSQRRAIVVAGHSAGGQFVSRYEMSNRVHETLGVAVTYVVANPSSYGRSRCGRSCKATRIPRPRRTPESHAGDDAAQELHMASSTRPERRTTTAGRWGWRIARPAIR
jgi:hypothetical protein